MCAALLVDHAQYTKVGFAHRLGARPVGSQILADSRHSVVRLRAWTGAGEPQAEMDHVVASRWIRKYVEGGAPLGLQSHTSNDNLSGA